MKKYLKHVEDGEIMDYSERLARHPKMQIVSEQEAFPERFADKAVTIRIYEAPAKASKVAAALKVAEKVTTPPPETTVSPELMADGARGFGRAVGINTTVGADVLSVNPAIEDSNAKSTLPAGLAGLENI